MDKANKKELQEIPPDRDALLNHIMSKLADRYQGYGSDIPEDKLDEIGFSLIANYGSLKLTAEEIGMSEARLRHLVRSNLLLREYFEIALEGIKTLTDSNLIEGLRSGDKDIVRLVATRLYAGRGRGGFNISEIGTTGYNDPIGKKIAAETENDRKKQSVKVEFHFVKKEIPTHRAIASVNDVMNDNAVDAEWEDVEDDDKQ